jgi:HTH-type transcriptional regulator, glycine betaine synthesis regulator
VILLQLGPNTPSTLLPVVTFERECIAFFEVIVQIFGVPKSVGQIYGLLYASPYPMGFGGIVERLRISKGSASQGLNLLRSLGAVVEARPKDSETRGAVFEPEMSLRQLVTGVLRERIAPLATPGIARLDRMKICAVQSSEHAEFYLERVHQLETWRKRFTTMLPLLTSVLGPKSENK